MAKRINAQNTRRKMDKTLSIYSPFDEGRPAKGQGVVMKDVSKGQDVMKECMSLI